MTSGICRSKARARSAPGGSSCRPLTSSSTTTISDLILHIRYTAREGGASFRTMTEKALGAILNEIVLVAGRKGLYVAFSLRDSFPNEWWQLGDTGSTSITIDEAHLAVPPPGRTARPWRR